MPSGQPSVQPPEQVHFIGHAGAAPDLLAARVSTLPAPARWYLTNERIILGVLSFGGFFLLWQVGSAIGRVNPFFFSSPALVLRAGAIEMQKARFWNDVRLSLTELVIGYFVAVVLGVLVGLLAGWYRRLNYFLDPWFSFMYALPRVALLPLIVLWLGLTMWSVVMAIFLGAFFTIVIGTRQGVSTVDHRFLDVASSFGASRVRLFWTVVLPSTVPFILASLRLGVGQALVGIFVGELFAANAGVGFMILVAGQEAQTDRLLFGVAIFTIAGVAIIESMRLLELRFQKWRPQARSA